MATVKRWLLAHLAGNETYAGLRAGVQRAQRARPHERGFAEVYPPDGTWAEILAALRS